MSKKKPHLETDKLVERAQSGDQEAFGLIYDELVTPVYRFIYYRVDPQVAEDLTEEAFLKAWTNIKKYKKDGQIPFSSWVFKIAQNLIFDYYRKHQTVDEIDENTADEERGSPMVQVSIKLEQVRLRKAISKLPDLYQQVVVLKYINELENDEIARTIGKSEGAVRTIQFRALQKLKVFLAG